MPCHVLGVLGSVARSRNNTFPAHQNQLQRKQLKKMLMFWAGDLLT